MKSNFVLMLFAVLLVVTSCDSTRIYDEYISLSNSSWSKENTVKFSFSVKDSLNKKNLFINLRNNKDYQYSNLFLITEMNFPDGQVVIDTLEYDMADVTGKFLGKGFSDIKQNKLFYKENIKFPIKGEYTFKVRQAMRKNAEIKGIEELKGITQVGFRIEKIE